MMSAVIGYIAASVTFHGICIAAFLLASLARPNGKADIFVAMCLLVLFIWGVVLLV